MELCTTFRKSGSQYEVFSREGKGCYMGLPYFCLVKEKTNIILNKEFEPPGTSTQRPNSGTPVPGP